MEGVLGAVFGLAFLLAVVWLERAAAAAERREDEELRAEIAHLPEDVRVRLWCAHYRARAERDLH